MSRNININSEVINLLKEEKVNVEDGISILTILYYNLKPSFIPEILLNKVLSLGIIDKDYTTNTLIWKKPLFEESVTGFEWVTEWMDLFKKVNPERRGTKADVIRRMKKFFVNNPSIRTDEVFEATKTYLRSLGDSQYCKKSHKFIYEQDGTSMLLQFIEAKKEEKEFGSLNEDMI